MEEKIKVYHMSQTLQVGDKLQGGYRGNKVRCNEFVDALEYAEKSLETIISSENLNGNEWREYVKWCVEGIFEFVRKTEFSYLPSRLDCSILCYKVYSLTLLCRYNTWTIVNNKTWIGMIIHEERVRFK